MIYKVLILIGLSVFSYGNPLSCEKVVDRNDVKLNLYVVKRKQFIRDNECIEASDSVIQNSKTKQIQELEGIVNGLHRFYISNIEVLKVNTFTGGHTSTPPTKKPQNSLSQRLSPISPFEGLCQSFIEVVNKSKYFILQILLGNKITSSNNFFH